jgi:hypothetical protein
MSMKSVLVPTENHDAMQSALETALLLARKFDSYVEGSRCAGESTSLAQPTWEAAFHWNCTNRA